MTTTQEKIMTCFDGTTKTCIVSDVETEVSVGKLIVSRTDTSGVITHMNKAFVDLSGYTEEELIGQPHNILRHPDMPKAVFAEIWKTIKAGSKWSGCVKNLRKDGGFYWVNATIIPNIRREKIMGVSSVRRKSSREAIRNSEKQYKEMLKEEQS